MTQKTSATKKTSKRQRRMRLAVSHEEFIPGTRLVVDDAGTAEIECGGKRYTSLSAYGSAAVGYAVNGWKFWQRAEEPEAE